LQFVACALASAIADAKAEPLLASASAFERAEAMTSSGSSSSSVC